MSQFVASIHLCPGSESDLLKEDRNAASYLQVTDVELIQFHNLLGFYKIGNEAVLIQPPIEIPSASFLVRPARDKNIAQFGALQKHFKTLHEPLDDGTLPTVQFGAFEFLQPPMVPGIPLRQNLSLLEAVGLRQVVPVGKVEADAKEHVVLPYLLVDSFAFRFALQELLLSVAEEEQRGDFEDLKSVDS